MATERRPIFIDSNNDLARFAPGDVVGIEHGGTGADTALGARAALGLAIGTDVQAFSGNLEGLAALAANGVVCRTGTNTFTVRNLTGTPGRIVITNADGVSGNPTIDLDTVSNAGGGSLLKLSVDSYGRVTGTSAVDTGDLTALLNGTYLSLTGGTLSGPLTLHADPLTAMQATTKQYVDNLFASGGQPPFAEVDAATTGPITLSGMQTIDGVVNPSEVLVKDQTDATQNGIYVTSAGAWSRRGDADTGVEFAPARTVFVQGGETNGSTSWSVGNTSTPTLGTDPITFVQTSGAATYNAGNGLTKVGNTFSVVAAGGGSSRIVVDGSGVDLRTIGSGGTHTKITYDAYGRVISGEAATASDVGAQPADATLTALAAFNSNGFMVQTATDTFTARTITVVSGDLTISNGDGVSGNPEIGLANTGVTPGTYDRVTVDAKGRVTSGSTVSYSGIQETLQNSTGSAVAIGRAVYISGAGTFAPANANSQSTKDVVGLVATASIPASGSGLITISGTLEATTGQWDAVTGQSGGLTPGAKYYLSNTTAGSLTTTAPSTGYLVPVGIAISTTKMNVRIGTTVKL